MSRAGNRHKARKKRRRDLERHRQDVTRKFHAIAGIARIFADWMNATAQGLRFFSLCKMEARDLCPFPEQLRPHLQKVAIYTKSDILKPEPTKHEEKP